MVQYSYTLEVDSTEPNTFTSFVISEVLMFLYALGFLKCGVLVVGIN